MFDDNQNLTTPSDSTTSADGTLSTHNDASGTPATFEPSTPQESTSTPTSTSTDSTSSSASPFDPTVIDTIAASSPSNGTDTAISSTDSSIPSGSSSSEQAISSTPEVIESTSEDTSSVASEVSGTTDLASIKQQALQEISPLLGQLDQAPEEKFRTTMMMIQAADNQSLIPTAYETAKQIKDDKARAQALLDVVNEINYFAGQTKETTKD